MSDISPGQNRRTVGGFEVHEEAVRYWETGELPDHFYRAQDYFVRSILDDGWHEANEGRHVVVFCPPGGEVYERLGEDSMRLCRDAYAAWGYRPLFCRQVTRQGIGNIEIAPGVPAARKYNIPASPGRG